MSTYLANKTTQAILERWELHGVPPTMDDLRDAIEAQEREADEALADFIAAVNKLIDDGSNMINDDYDDDDVEDAVVDYARYLRDGVRDLEKRW